MNEEERTALIKQMGLADYDYALPSSYTKALQRYCSYHMIPFQGIGGQFVWCYDNPHDCMDLVGYPIALTTEARYILGKLSFAALEQTRDV